MHWGYETQGFSLGGEWYLPDFWIPLRGPFAGRHEEGNPPEKGFWVEIKPTTPTADEKRLCRLLAEHTRHKVYLLAGDVYDREFATYRWSPKGGYGFTPADAMWCAESGLPSDFLFYLIAEACPDTDENGVYRFDRIQAAFDAARSARFEHGETPR